MCIPGLDPITLATILASTAASAGGAFINNQIQNDAVERQNRENQRAAEQANLARSQEAARQMQLERQQADEVAKALTKANPETALMAAQTVAEAPTNEIATPVYNEAVIDPVHNQVVARQAAPREVERRSATQERMDAMALLSALDGQFGLTGDAIQRAGSNIQTLGGYRQGSLNANAAETAYRPATVTPSSSMIGDLLLLGGQAGASMAGGMIGSGDAASAIVGGGARRAATHPSRLLLASGGLY